MLGPGIKLAIGAVYVSEIPRLTGPDPFAAATASGEPCVDERSDSPPPLLVRPAVRVETRGNSPHTPQSVGKLGDVSQEGEIRLGAVSATVFPTKNASITTDPGGA
jgi:hypothetical protein